MSDPSQPSPSTPTKQPKVRVDWPSLFDIIAVVLFASGGLKSHGESAGIGQVIHVAIPFIVGAALGRIAADLRRLDPWSYSAGLVIATCAVGIGMLGRVLLGDKVAWSFVAVAIFFLFLLMLAWRWLAKIRANGPRLGQKANAARDPADAGEDANPDAPTAAAHDPAQPENRPGDSSSGSGS